MDKRIAEIGLSGFLAAFAFAAFLVIPLVGPIVSLGSATPILLTGTRRGVNTATTASLAGALLLSFSGWHLAGPAGGDPLGVLPPRNAGIEQFLRSLATAWQDG